MPKSDTSPTGHSRTVRRCWELGDRRKAKEEGPNCALLGPSEERGTESGSQTIRMVFRVFRGLRLKGTAPPPRFGFQDRETKVLSLF